MDSQGLIYFTTAPVSYITFVIYNYTYFLAGRTLQLVMYIVLVQSQLL